jgi:hypothetical protein
MKVQSNERKIPISVVHSHFNIENVLWEARLFQGRVRVTEPSSGNDVRNACTMLAYNYVLSELGSVTRTRT